MDKLTNKLRSLLSTRKNHKFLIIAGALVFGGLMTALLFSTRASSVDALVLATSNKNCSNEGGTTYQETSSSSSKRNIETCQLSSGNFRPSRYSYGNRLESRGDWGEVISKLKSDGFTEVETCIWIKAIGNNNAVIDIHALGFTDADSRNVTVTRDDYNKYCILASLTTGDDQNSGFTIKSGTVRVSSIVLDATKDGENPPPPPPEYIDVCRDNQEIKILVSERRSSDTNLPCAVVPIEYVTVCRDGEVLTISEDDVIDTDTDPPCEEDPEDPVDPVGVPQGYNENVDFIKSISGTYNQFFNSNAYVNTPSAQLPINTLTKAQAQPSIGDKGKFRTHCEFSHLAYDDPLVFPGQPGKSHLHAFYGNTETNAYSTIDTQLNRGDSTCDGGPLNRTGYWIPAMFDGKGNSRIADSLLIYYKAGSNDIADKIVDYPKGLGVITGNGKAESPQNPDIAGWYCHTVRDNSKPLSPTIPRCASNENLYGWLNFPTCNTGGIWELDQSHMKFTKQHPPYGIGEDPCTGKQYPWLAVFVRFHEHDGSTDNWYLSSDVRSNNTVKKGGTTFHGDWFNGWNNEVNNIFNKFCNKERRNCGVSNLGNGRALPEAYASYQGDKFVQNSGMGFTVPANKIVQLCPGKSVPSNHAELAFCN